jgi:hypothetical protein
MVQYVASSLDLLHAVAISSQKILAVADSATEVALLSPVRSDWELDIASSTGLQPCRHSPPHRIVFRPDFSSLL